MPSPFKYFYTTMGLSSDKEKTRSRDRVEGSSLSPVEPLDKFEQRNDHEGCQEADQQLMTCERCGTEDVLQTWKVYDRKQEQEGYSARQKQARIVPYANL
jgi:hypothetical protein